MKRLLSLFIALTIILSMVNGFAINVSADESGYAWVLVDTYQFPIPEDFKPGDPWSYFASLEGNTAELQTTIPYGLGIYASKDESNPGNLHVKYTWSNPPTIIQANETISIAFEQEVFSNKTGNFGVAISPFLSLDVADLIGLGYGTASGVEAKVIYEDGTETRWFGIGYGQDDRSQTSCSANMTLKFKDKGSAGDRWALYIGAYAGPPGKVGVRYTYEWKQISNPTTITVTALTTGSSDLGKYSWEGEWDSNWGKMVLIQSGSAVTGTYTHDKGKISGTISGNTLTGTWSESPSYAPPSDAGDIEFTMAADGKSA